MDWSTAFQMLAALGGARMQQRAISQAQDRQSAAIQAAQAEQDALAQQRNQAILQSAEQFAPPQAMQQYEQGIAQQAPRLEGVAQQAAQAQVARPAGASGAFDTHMQERSAAELQRALAEAGMRARASGAGRLGFEQQLQQANDASGLNDMAAQMSSAARRGNRQITNAGRVNAGNMVAGQLLQAGAPLVGRFVGGR